MISIRSLAFTTAIVGLLGGCAVGPNYHAPKPDLPPQFGANMAKNDVQPVNAEVNYTRWWETFNDPQLTSLVQRAIAANLDLQIAVTRLQEANTAEAAVVGAIFPAVGATGAAATGTGSDLTRGRADSALTSADNAHGGQIRQAVGFEGGLTIDLFGQLRREIEAARDDAQAAAAARNDVTVTVIAQVARAYFNLRGLEMRSAALAHNVAAVQQSLDFVQQRFGRGLTNELDVTLAQRELSTLQAQVAPLNAQIAAARYGIAVLLGQYPESMEAEFAKPGMILGLPATVKTGLPVELLRRRPDVREAERQLAASTARIGVATANLFPHLDVTGAVGWQKLAGTAAGTSSQIWSAGPGGSWSILDFGTLDAFAEIADLRSREYLLAYKRTILQAVQDVDGAIDSYTAEQDSLKNLEEALVASQRSVTLATQRYDRGLTDFLNVLDAQRQEYQLEDQYAAEQQAAANALVSLYRGLGGGWEDFQAVPHVHQPQPVILAAFERLFNPSTGR